jgi:hypothetical protein
MKRPHLVQNNTIKLRTRTPANRSIELIAVLQTGKLELYTLM